MGAVGAAMPMVGGVLGAVGVWEEERGKQADAVENRRIALEAAADAIARGNQDAARQRMTTTQLVGQQKVALATSGVDATSGTAASIQARSRMMGELDARTIQNNAVREAWGFKKKEQHIKEQAKRSQDAANLRAAGSILGGVGQTVGNSGGG